MGQMLYGETTPSSAPKNGYHVLQVSSNGPGDDAGVIPYFDFIENENGLVEKILASSVGKPVELTIYNSRWENYRDVTVIPSDSWGGAGVAGLSIRYCSFENIASHVWHILDVQPGSPANLAGLQSHTDYVVGSPEFLFSASEDFFSLIQTAKGHIPLYVYSSKTNKVRLVNLTPNKSWGGPGSLGCDIGYGYLHQIPVGPKQPEQKEELLRGQKPVPTQHILDDPEKTACY